MEIPPNHEMNILLKMRHTRKETKKGNSRDFIIFPNLKMLKRKGLISNTNAICSKNNFILKFFNPFSTGVKLQKQDVLAFALEADNKFQSYLDKVLVRKIRRNVEKDEKTRKNEEILNILTLAEEQMSTGGEICELNSAKKKEKYIPLIQDFDKDHFRVSPEERRKFILAKFKLDENQLLAKKDKERIIQIFSKHWGTLDYTGYRMPKVREDIMPPYHIKTFGQPKISKVRYLNPELSKQVREILNDWLKMGVVRESVDSPFGAGLVVVPKKDGALRLTVDYRSLNEFTVNEAYPVPNIEAGLRNLAGNRFYSNLDCKSAYYSIPLDEQSIPKTAVMTPFGKYEFLRLSMGLKNAVSVFCRLIHRVLAEHTPSIALPYLDDVLIYGPTLQSHLDNLEAVIASVADSGLLLNAEKCNLVSSSVTFLGFEVSEQGIRPNKKYAEKMQDIPMPKTLGEIRQITGMFNFFRKCIPDYAKIMRPINDKQRGFSKDTNRNTQIDIGPEGRDAIE